PFMQNSPTANSPVQIAIYSESKGILTENKRFFSRAIFSSLCIMLSSLLLLIFSSCTSTKNTAYFQNLQKDTTLTNLASKNYEPLIQKNDLLGITVASLSPDVAFYNAPQNAVGTLTGYLVDENGNISFLKIGILHVEGLTRKALKDTLEKSLIPYLKGVVVSVGFLNRHVTMLGGISPQVLPMPGDNMTILDALAASGDIADKGRSDNVLVIREKDDAKEFKRLNLTDNSIFYSPYFYLQPNDIVYVEPVKTKENHTPQILSYVTAGITFLIFILNQLLK
ncbi:MAG: polysaccharide biosynthesis/export family protein, partial [Ginsengibacter sp.]